MLPAIASFLPSLMSQVGTRLRRNPVGLFVRGGRVLYIGSAGFITLAAYTGWKNQNNNAGFLETLRTGKWKPEDADKPLVGNAVKAAGKATGAGVNGISQTVGFNENDYNKRLQSITVIARSFGLGITSGKRTAAENAAAGGVPNSMHLVENGALAFDASSGPGPISPEERRFYEWAKSRPDLFQDVLLHNSGSGWHVHVEFRPEVTTIQSAHSGQN